MFPAYKANMQKSVAFLYTDNRISGKENLWKYFKNCKFNQGSERSINCTVKTEDIGEKKN